MIVENKDRAIEFDLSFEIANIRFLCNNVYLNDRMWLFFISNKKKDETFFVLNEKENENSDWNRKNVDDRMFLMLNWKLFRKRDCFFKDFEMTKRKRIIFFNLWLKNILNFVFWIVSKIFLRRLRNLKIIEWKELKIFRKWFWNLKKISINETVSFKSVVNKNFASLKTIFLMFLNDRSWRLKTFESEKNEKTLKTFLCELSDDENFINEKTLIMK